MFSRMPRRRSYRIPINIRRSVAVAARHPLPHRTTEAIVRIYDNFISGAVAPSGIQMGF
jgi:hypothetical protein